MTPALPHDRVRARTAPRIQDRIDRATEWQLQRCAGAAPSDVARRLRELDREWDIDRVIEAHASAGGLAGMLIGLLGWRALLLAPALLATAVLAQAQGGQHPLIPLLRRLGVRTAQEIARERFALKALRGDFETVDAAEAASSGHAPALRRLTALMDAADEPLQADRADDHAAAPTALRVELHTEPALNARVRALTEAQLGHLAHAGPAAIAHRLADLDDEWDIERVLQTNAASLVLGGLVLGTLASRRFLLLPLAVLAFLGQHALQGWCPPIPLLRRLGFRTAREIARERHAIKALRGDFAQLPPPDTPSPQRVIGVLRAVDA